MNALLYLFGYRGLLLNADPTVWDRYRWLRKHLTKGAVRTLDAGCGAGGFTFFAAHEGNTAVGISNFEPGLEATRQRGKILKLTDRTTFMLMDLMDLDRRRERLGSFEQIICFETLEHLDDDSRLVKELGELLQPGGRLLITTPTHDHHPFFGETENTGGHVRWGYTHAELRALCEGAGLIVTHEDYISGVVSQKIASLMFRLSRINLIFAWTVVLPLRLLQILDRPLTRMTRYPYLSASVVAQRPA